MTAELRVGTSGWNYGDWRGIFYPAELAGAEYLGWYSRHFDTAELNYSFYRLPRPSTYEKWAAETPEGFVLALKVSRFITHIRRLEGTEDAWQRFLENARALGGKLGPLLLQLPPSFKADAGRLERFLAAARRGKEEGAARLAFEFRHSSWFEPGILELLQRLDVALVIAQSERYPQAPLTPTASFVYLRFHGPGRLFSSEYTDEQLAEWAGRIHAWRAQGRAVFAYFNNDFHGYAVSNARTLLRLAGGR